MEDAGSAPRQTDLLENAVEVVQGKILDLNTSFLLVFARIDLRLRSEKMGQTRFEVHDLGAKMPGRFRFSLVRVASINNGFDLTH